VCTYGDGAAVSTPVHLERDRIRVPDDGEGYPRRVRSIFGSELAALILDRSAELQP
jgi:hypothetical protein